MSAGSSSWSTGESTDSELHRLLHVRQALPGQTDVVLDPPALRHRPSAVDVPPDQLPAALAEWGRWWRAVLALTILRRGHEVPSTDPALERARELCPLEATMEEAGPTAGDDRVQCCAPPTPPCTPPPPV